MNSYNHIQVLQVEHIRQKVPHLIEMDISIEGEMFQQTFTMVIDRCMFFLQDARIIKEYYCLSQTFTLNEPRQDIDFDGHTEENSQPEYVIEQLTEVVDVDEIADALTEALKVPETLERHCTRVRDDTVFKAMGNLNPHRKSA